MEQATLGGGCFWCLEAIFVRQAGVSQVVSGYAGGTKPSPSYEEVCSGTTGHAEVVQIDYDPTVIDYGQILEIFWQCHDPTTRNRQGADVGTQYRSIILYHNSEQQTIAEASCAEQNRLRRKPVVTQVEQLTKFYRAEEHHQNYYANHPHNGYCAVVIKPKLRKMKLA